MNAHNLSYPLPFMKNASLTHSKNAHTHYKHKDYRRYKGHHRNIDLDNKQDQRNERITTKEECVCERIGYN